MSKYIIDEKGGVSFPHPGEPNTFIGVQPEDVEKKIAAGKFTDAEVAQIRNNRQNHAQQALTQNVPVCNEEPLGMPDVMGTNKSTPAKDNKPLGLPSMNFGKSKTSAASKKSKSKGERPLEMPVMNFDEDD